MAPRPPGAAGPCRWCPHGGGRLRSDGRPSPRRVGGRRRWVARPRAQTGAPGDNGRAPSWFFCHHRRLHGGARQGCGLWHAPPLGSRAGLRLLLFSLAHGPRGASSPLCPPSRARQRLLAHRQPQGPGGGGRGRRRGGGAGRRFPGRRPSGCRRHLGGLGGGRRRVVARPPPHRGFTGDVLGAAGVACETCSLLAAGR